MTQTALGKFLGGVSQPTISMWETGAVPFDLAAIRARFEGRDADG
jgi:DNA-binding XRE family transcriptional regulator